MKCEMEFQANAGRRYVKVYACRNCGREVEACSAPTNVDCATLPASTPPGDACVRHACKRVRMEMQAEIERLRGLLRRCYTERMTDELDEAIGAAIKGDSHAS